MMAITIKVVLVMVITISSMADGDYDKSVAGDVDYDRSVVS